MRNRNGYGGVVKLKGKRNKPYMAYISEMQAEGVVIPPAMQKSLEAAAESLQGATNPEEAAEVFAKAMWQLHSLEMSEEEYIAMLHSQLQAEMKKKTFKSKQVKKPIGYFKTSPEAHIALAEYNKKPYDLDKRTITFKEVYELAYADARIDRLTKSSLASYKAGFDKCKPIWDTPMCDIKLMQLQDIVNSCSTKSRSTQGNIITVQKLVYTYACKNDLADKDYSAFVKIVEHKKSKAKKAYTREEIKLLWDNIDWKYKGERKSILDGETVADILLILIYTGMRIEELLLTASSDVHLEERYIMNRGTKTENALRIVPIHKDILPILEKRLARNGENLIVTEAGNPIEYSNFHNPVFKKFCKAFDLKHSIHETRHSFATYTAHIDSTLRSYMIGHSTGSLTNDVYTHPEVLLPELIAEIDKVDFLNAKIGSK